MFAHRAHPLGGGVQPIPEKTRFNRHTTMPMLRALDQVSTVTDLATLLFKPPHADAPLKELMQCSNTREIQDLLQTNMHKLTPAAKHILSTEKTTSSFNHSSKKQANKLTLFLTGVQAAICKMKTTRPSLKPLKDSILKHPLFQRLNSNMIQDFIPNFLDRLDTLLTKYQSRLTDFLSNSEDRHPTLLPEQDEGVPSVLSTFFLLSQVHEDQRYIKQTEALTQQLAGEVARAYQTLTQIPTTFDFVEELVEMAKPSSPGDLKKRLYLSSVFSVPGTKDTLHHVSVEGTISTDDPPRYTIYLYNLGKGHGHKGDKSDAVETIECSSKELFLKKLKTLFANRSKPDYESVAEGRIESSNVPDSAIVSVPLQQTGNCTVWNTHFMLEKISSKDSANLWEDKRIDIITKELFSMYYSKDDPDISMQELKERLSLVAADYPKGSEKQQSYIRKVNTLFGFDVISTQSIDQASQTRLKPTFDLTPNILLNQNN